MSKSTKSTKPAPTTTAPAPVPKPAKQTSQTTKRMAFNSQPLGTTNPEYGIIRNHQRHCLDGCLKRAEKAAKNKPKINYDKMFD